MRHSLQVLRELWTSLERSEVELSRCLLRICCRLWVIGLLGHYWLALQFCLASLVRYCCGCKGLLVFFKMPRRGAAHVGLRPVYAIGTSRSLYRRCWAGFHSHRQTWLVQNLWLRASTVCLMVELRRASRWWGGGCKWPSPWNKNSAPLRMVAENRFGVTGGTKRPMDGEWRTRQELRDVTM